MEPFVLPVGRLVSGDLYSTVNRTDSQGNPKTLKNGDPSVECKFGLAIRKGGESHWSQTEWGNKIFTVGAQAFPREHTFPSFAWKITDGDSTIPNKRGNIPANNENFRGNWILWLAAGRLPPLYYLHGGNPLREKGAIKLGYFIEVIVDVKGNASPTSPGVYLNHCAVALKAEGDIIAGEADTSLFSTAPQPLPPGARPLSLEEPRFTGGASEAPASAPAAFTPAASAAPASAPAAFAPASAPAAFAPASAPAAFAPAATPNPAFLHPSTAAPAAPAPAAPAPGLVMTARANGATIQQFYEKGWTDEALLRDGYAVRG